MGAEGQINSQNSNLKDGQNNPEENEEDKKPKIAPEVDPSKPIPTIVETIIVNMDRVVYEGRAKSVIIPVPYGNLAVLPGHTPLFTKLAKGSITVTPEYGNPSNYDVDNGIAKITQFKAIILIGFLGK